MPPAFPDLSGLTILLIEDDPDVLQVLAMALTVCGAEVLTATNTASARVHLERAKLDLVVTDLGLSGETGAAFISWLRMQPRDRGGSLPAVAVTGYPKEFPALRVGGFAAYFQKPFDWRKVCATISALVRSPSGPSALLRL